ncbi:MAG: DUF3575 domain-containing protein [Bacteroidota bacterium]
MKKIVIALFFALSVSGAFAQVLATANSPEYKNLLKMSASLFTRSTFQMGYERFVDQNTSVYVTAGLNFKDSQSEQMWGIRNEVQMRFHVYTVIEPRESSRLYFAPYLINQYLETQNYRYNTNGNYSWQTDSFDAIGGGMLFGWSYSFANRINLDIYTGGGFRKTLNYEPNTNIYDNNVFDYGYSGIVPRLGIDIGFWF